MHPRVERWLKIILVAICVTPLMGFLSQLGYDQLMKNQVDFFPFGDELVVIFVAVVLLIWLHSLAGFRPAQTLQYFKYPGFPVAVIVALIAQISFSKLSTAVIRNESALLSWLLASYICAFSISFIWALLRDFEDDLSAAKSIPLSAPRTSLENMQIDGLLAWVDDEREIEDQTEDYFGFSPRAERVLNILARETRNTVALVGPYGGGKSSLVRLIQQEALRREARNDARPLWFCRVSCWGFEKGDSAPEAILRHVVEFL